MPAIVYEKVNISDIADDLWSVVAVKGGTQIPFGNKFIKIADFDTFLSMNGKHESQVVQNAIEQGNFRSVNKIRKPNICTIELAKGGSMQEIQLVLDSLKKYKDSTDLLTINTPFGSLTDMNLIGLEYSFRQRESAGMLIAKLTLQEIQSGDLGLEYTTSMVASPDLTNTQNIGQKEVK